MRDGLLGGALLLLFGAHYVSLQQLLQSLKGHEGVRVVRLHDAFEALDQERIVGQL